MLSESVWPGLPAPTIPSGMSAAQGFGLAAEDAFPRVAALFRLHLPGHREPQLCWQGGTASGIAAGARLTVQPAAQGFGNRFPEAPDRVSIRMVRLLLELGFGACEPFKVSSHFAVAVGPRRQQSCSLAPQQCSHSPAGLWAHLHGKLLVPYRSAGPESKKGGNPRRSVRVNENSILPATHLGEMLCSNLNVR